MADEFEEALRARGAVVAAVHGVPVPLAFGDPAREWRAMREGAAVVAGTFRRVLAVRGDDRVAFLQGMLSNDVNALQPGQGTYAALLTQQGRVVSDLRVYAEADRMLLDTVAWREDAVRDALERFIVADDVELAAAAEQPLVGVLGPLAAAVAGEALGTTDLPRRPYEHTWISCEGARVLTVAVRECGVEALLFCTTPAGGAALLAACIEAGAQPAGMTAIETVRIERGVPWAGVDMDESTLLMETGCDEAISFTKGCYLGQEVVERIAARGHVNRRLVGVAFDADDPPPAATPLLAEGHEVGYVTSAVRSPAVGRAIALAMMQRKHTAAGGSVETPAGIAGTITPLPFA
jgi:folate-binding protein YgfZ